jgi:long-chain acyl-CoA synthetase
MSATHLLPTPLPRFGWTQSIATSVATLLARAFCSLEVQGREHLPPDEPCLLCANHSSHADTFALATAAGLASRRLVFLGAGDYFWRCTWRRLLVQRLICLVNFERGSGVTAAKHNLRTLAACRDDHRIIVLFPEGTRSPDGTVGTFKPGAAMFADRLGLAIVPCWIDGAYEVLPKGGRLPRARRLRVIFGPPMTIPVGSAHETGAERAERYDAFIAQVQEIVVQLGQPSEQEALAS